jgi:enoyl-CoA hydratase/carnithine racemase
MSDAAATDKIVTRKEGGISWLIFNQPEKRNAISLDMSVRALEVVEEFARDDSARALVLAGAGDKAFVSGADISEFEKRRNSAEAAAEYQRISTRMFDAVRDVEKPTVAMIHGFCFGGGVALAACCDIRLCAEDALFSVPAAKLGIGYRIEFTKLLVDLIGPSYTKEFLYTARRYTAEEALAMGFVNRVVPKADLEGMVRTYAEGIAENAPLTQKAAKVIVNEILKDPAQRDVARCNRLIAECADSDDYKNARRAFMEKKKPVFVGR